jgi:glutamate racemase
MSAAPIGIFDSGIGGLTVCKAVHDLMPEENIIYYGDTARFPYGTRSIDTIIRYSREITDYLLSRNVKMIVIACNTSSAAALETLREEYEVPIIGVIEAGARAACQTAERNRIGVIATRATVRSGSYEKAIQRIRPEVEVIQQQATLFVPITEEGLLDHEITRVAVQLYLDDMYEKGVRTVILGCTHFPLLKDAIHSVYDGLNLVDTGMEIALEARNILLQKDLANDEKEGQKGTIELYASDITDAMLSLKELFFQEKGAKIEQLIPEGNVYA